MDLSALIFVALAVAWVVYLVPKALRHHEEDAVSRSVDRFSDRMRVLARREAVSSSAAALVTGAASAASAPSAEPVEAPTKQTTKQPAAPTPAPRALRSPVARRAAARRAAQRRRRVLGVLVLLNVVVAGLAVGAVVAAPWIAAPLTLLVAWLVACRLMVRNERAARAAVLAPARRRRRTLADEEIAAEDAATGTAPEPDLPAEPGGVVAELADDDTGEIPAITAEVADGWTPVAVPLPMYVAKAPAGRTVRTIDLDATGVWSSGRNEADSQLAREADSQRSADAAAAAAAADADERRATGS
ncbi:hypothetical protein ACFJIY_07760 [Pimelobacter simplex]|uniref:divisome protein SepX/GlpR n=1 Tax=Nocardioides simplex TaxID=2045 RepID=UPI00366A87FA